MYLLFSTLDYSKGNESLVDSVEKKPIKLPVRNLYCHDPTVA